MFKPKRMLVVLDPVDGDLEQDPGLLRALFLAREMGMALHLVLVYEPGGGSLVPESVDEGDIYCQLQTRLSRFSETCAQREGVEIHSEVVVQRHRYQVVVERAASLRPDYVVKATHHDTTLNRTLFNYSDWYLIRFCPCPLLLVKSEDLWATRRVLACVNPAHVHSQLELLDNVIIEAAQSLAYRLRGELHIYHSVETWQNPLEAVSTTLGAATESDISQRHRDLVEDLLHGYGLGSQRLHITAGRPEKTLVPLSQRVLDKLHCDILVVKSQPLEVKDALPAGLVPC
jgi:universal stress protein E